jgi:hypothetical protein
MFCTQCGQKLNEGDKYCPKCGYRAEQIGQVEAKEQRAEPEIKAEIIFRKILGAVSLPLIFLAFTGGLFGLMPLLLFFSLYLLISKKYNLALDIFWFLIGLALYIMPLPLFGISLFFGLKGAILISNWSVVISMFLPKILILVGGIFLLTTNILAKSKKLAKLGNKFLISFGVTLGILGIFLALTFLRPIVASPGPATGISASYGAGGATILKIDQSNTLANFDPEKNLWTYQISAKNQSGEDGKIIKIVSLKHQIAPPFEDIEVIEGVKTNEKIIIKPGTMATLKIYSKEPFFVITIFEERGRYDISFLR